MKAKKQGKFLTVMLLLLILGLFLESDDKELFMGFNVMNVKPNVVILMDTSEVMNSIIWYPKYGLDGMGDTADDGYDPAVNYEGTLDGFGFEGDKYWENFTTNHHARWIYNGSALQFTRSELVGIGPNNESYVTGCYADDGTAEPVKFKAGSNGRKYFNVGDHIIYRGPNGDALATIVAKEDETGTENSWITLGDIVGERIIAEPNAWSYEDRYQFQKAIDANYTPVIADLYGPAGHPEDTKALYQRNYLKWLYIHANDDLRAAVSYFSNYGTFDVTVDPADIPTASDCSTENKTRDRYVFTRIQVAREVSCKVAYDAVQIVRLGLFKFKESFGADIMDPLNDMSESASLLNAYKDAIYDKMHAVGDAPIAEALADVWWYYRPGPSSKAYYPVNRDSADSSTHIVEHWCQNSYIVLVSGGESTYDEFSGNLSTDQFSDSMFTQWPVHRPEPWQDWIDGWGDSDYNEADAGIPSDYDPAASIYCPNWTCWQRLQPDGSDKLGSDYADDVAYFLANSDLFPEKNHNDTANLYTDWPGKQGLYTYTIGFGADNDMLRAIAVNGDGGYYTASDYDELIEAFRSVFTSIILRNFAFSAITAPKKTATAMNEDLSVSYVGYFMPSTSASVWEGHLLAYELIDKWGFDVDNSGEVDSWEFIYDSENLCHENSGGQTCVRFIELAAEQSWDAAEKLPANRGIYTHYPGTTALLGFEDANVGVLQPLFGAETTGAETQMILDEIRQPQLGDIFHADVVFVGPPYIGKKFVTNTDSLDPAAQPYEQFWEAHQNRRRVLFTGSNDGVLHMIYGDDPVHMDGRDAGKEIWGFIPDDVLPSLKRIVIDGQHTYTVDGRLRAQDIFYKPDDASPPSWATVLGFGLREGGRAFYQLDISTVGTEPTIMWKFKDAAHSGRSWARPAYGKIRLPDPLDPDNVIDKWVVVLAGGYAFNNENPHNVRGKAVFIVDAGSGELLWMFGYHAGGAEDSDTTDWLDTSSNDGIRHLSNAAVLNFPVPSAVTAVDKDADSFLDYIYFGNTGGHLFKIDVSSKDMAQWHTYLLYQTEITTTAATDITAISASGDEITVSRDVFAVGQVIIGQTSRAMGQILAKDHRLLTVRTLGGTFQLNENVLHRTYDPIFVAPGVTLDRCSNLWVAFGTGDRDHPRTNPTAGRFFVIKDNGSLGLQKGSLTQLTWTGDTLDPLGEGVTITNGWYFDFYSDDSDRVYEKFFDPEPVILPDQNMVPHIFMNTYTSPRETIVNQEDPCDMPGEGIMTIYDIALANCGDNPGGGKQGGRIAGGGIYQGREYVMYVGIGEVASVPPMEQTEARRLPYPGGIIFWKEKKR